MIVKKYLFSLPNAFPWRLLLCSAVFFLFCLNIAQATYPPTFSDCLRGDGEDYEQLDACQQLVRSNPKNYDLRVALGKTLDKRQKYKQAVVAYKKALLAFPGDSYFLKKQAQAKSNLEEQQWIKNKNKRKTATQAENNSSASPQYRLNKVRCIRLTGIKALKACEQAIKINAKDASLFVSKGDIYASQQQNKLAITAYQTAMALDPKDKRTSKKLNTLLHNSQKREKQKKQSKNIVTKSNKTNNKKVTKPVKTNDVAKNKTVEKSKVAGKAGKDEKDNTLTKSKTVTKPETVVKSSPIKASPVNAVASEAKTVTTATEKVPQVKETAIVLNTRQQEFIAQLNLLKSLKEQQIISRAEYDKRKKSLLDSTFRIPEAPVKKTETLINNPTNDFADINFGNYHALIIGNNQYEHLTQLQTAVHDAEALAQILEQQYGFKVKLLLNANRYETLKAMGEFRNTLAKNDNLLIYYAGHGVLDKASERGYWLPVDAERDFTANWISTSEITDTLKALQSWHVLVVADSCYSGTLVRSAAAKITNPEEKSSLIRRLLDKKSRTVITSGGLEPVTDSGRDNHSVFAAAFLDVLNKNQSVVEAESVFSQLRDKVILNADQTPEYSNVRKVGHNGGDFIFLRH